MSIKGGSILIAEIGNAHFGSMKKAKELIKAAHNSGADLIKGQAFKACDITSGSMTRAFYRKCELMVEEYLELIEYARSIGNDMFYSIFSEGFEQVSLSQKWHKISGAQTRAGKADEMADIENMFISIPIQTALNSMHRFEHAEIMHVSDYMPDNPNLDHIEFLSDWLGRPVGYSDHTIGVDTAIHAHKEYGSQIIEKHFCLKHNEKYGRTVFRDTIHGATPREFEKLAKAME